MKGLIRAVQPPECCIGGGVIAALGDHGFAPIDVVMRDTFGGDNRNQQSERGAEDCQYHRGSDHMDHHMNRAPKMEIFAIRDEHEWRLQEVIREQMLDLQQRDQGSEQDYGFSHGNATFLIGRNLAARCRVINPL